jgi:hypothetical protein
MKIYFQVGGSIIQDNLDDYTYFIYNNDVYTKIQNQDAVKKALKKGVYQTIIEEPDGKKYDVVFIYNSEQISLNEMIVVAVLNSDVSKKLQFRLGSLNSILNKTLQNFLDRQKESSRELIGSIGQPIRIKPVNISQITNIKDIIINQTIIISQVSGYINFDTPESERVVYYNRFTVKSKNGKSIILSATELGDYFVPNDYMEQLIRNNQVYSMVAVAAKPTAATRIQMPPSIFDVSGSLRQHNPSHAAAAAPATAATGTHSRMSSSLPAAVAASDVVAPVDISLKKNKYLKFQSENTWKAKYLKYKNKYLQLKKL